MLFLYHKCNCKSYPVIFQSVVVDSSIKLCDQTWLHEEVKLVNDSRRRVVANKVFKRGLKNVQIY